MPAPVSLVHNPEGASFEPEVMVNAAHCLPRVRAGLPGSPLAPIRENPAAVSALDTPLWLRIPVVPVLNDDNGSLTAAAQLAARMTAVQRVTPVPCRRTADGKRWKKGGAKSTE